MSWNYRVVKQVDTYQVSEVWYDNDGKPNGWAFVHPHGGDMLELLKDVEMMQRALDKPILEIVGINLVEYVE